MSSKLHGIEEMVTRLKELARKTPARVESALYMEAQIVMTEAKRRCPVASDGGQLRGSGTVKPPTREGRKVSVLMAFGGIAAPYAIAVHETPSPHDPPSWQVMYEHGGLIHWTSAGTGPKFLEGPINEAQPQMNARIATRMNVEKGDE